MTTPTTTPTGMVMSGERVTGLVRGGKQVPGKKLFANTVRTDTGQGCRPGAP